MTRRIRLAIVLTAWVILAVGGLSGYLVIRQVLLEELDEAIVARASALPRFVGVDAAAGQIPLPPGDRYIIKNASGQTLAWVGRDSERARQPEVISREFATLADRTRVRRVTLRAMQEPNPVTIVYSGSAERFDQALSQLAAVLLMTGLLCAVGSAWVARWVTRSVVKPLDETAQLVGEIDENNLSRRIDMVALPAELRPVALRLNEMLARLESNFSRRKQCLADAAHELRTPVAALMTTLEVALMRPRDPAALKQTLSDCLADVRFLRRLVERLLEHARAEGSADAIELVDVSALLSDCVRTAQTLGAERNIHIEAHFESGLQARLASQRLRSVVMNLLGNAVEYNRPDGHVELECIRRSGQMVLHIRDDGPGIAPEHLPHIFEPFYRGDLAHQRTGEHCGLGLFLVKSHVDAMKGTIEIDSRNCRGTTFTVYVPMEWEVARPLPPAGVDEPSERVRHDPA